jgi:hypothetical protein
LTAVVLALFAAGHTAGFLTFRPASPEALQTMEAMRNVHFDFGGASVTWAQLYTGFGLFVSAALVLLAWLAWKLGSWSTAMPAAALSGGRALLAFQLANVLICVRYFAMVQAIFAAVGALTVVMALKYQLPGADAQRSKQESRIFGAEEV